MVGKLLELLQQAQLSTPPTFEQSSLLARWAGSMLAVCNAIGYMPGIVVCQCPPGYITEQVHRPGPSRSPLRREHVMKGRAAMACIRFHYSSKQNTGAAWRVYTLPVTVQGLAPVYIPNC